MYVYICACMQFVYYREKWLSMNVHMCMYVSVYVYICTYLYCICFFCQDCESEHHFCSVSWLLPRRCACRAWNLAGCGHDSSLQQEKSSKGGAIAAWPTWNCTSQHCSDAPMPQCPSGGMEFAENPCWLEFNQ